MTGDICSLCDAWLILVEVQYFPRNGRGSDDSGGRLVYECPACHHVFERSMATGAPLRSMSRRDRSLRTRVAAWRHIIEV